MFGSGSSKRFKACKEKKNIGISRFWIILLIGIAVSCILAYRLVAVIEPSVESIAEIKAKEMVSYIINEATRKQFFKESTDINKLLIIKTDKEGNIDMVQSNTVAMNIMAAELGKEIKDMYRSMEPSEMKVPLGTILGSQIMSQADFNVNLKVLPLSVSDVEFSSELETQGINQTKYKVYLSLTSKVKVMAPFSSKTMEIHNMILVSEAVILGKVPNSYINVPKEGIMDSINVVE